MEPLQGSGIVRDLPQGALAVLATLGFEMQRLWRKEIAASELLIPNSQRLSFVLRGFAPSRDTLSLKTKKPHLPAVNEAFRVSDDSEASVGVEPTRDGFAIRCQRSKSPRKERFGEFSCTKSCNRYGGKRLRTVDIVGRNGPRIDSARERVAEAVGGRQADDSRGVGSGRKGMLVSPSPPNFLGSLGWFRASQALPNASRQIFVDSKISLGNSFDRSVEHG